MVRVGKKYRFSASHRLHSPALSAEENRELYGKCNNPYGHGHDYVLEVVVAGAPDAVTGLVVRMGQLDEYVRREVISEFDHKYMNEEIEVFRDLPPTTENVARVIRERLVRGWRAAFPSSASLDSVRIHETRRNIVELGGDMKEAVTG
ncbi:MAG: 6-carboxytetrahydropterin synthase [Bryobacterales bacterium]|nr:6-carboxytetrahydropterin synthase [Bryobacterales bacterium]